MTIFLRLETNPFAIFRGVLQFLKPPPTARSSARSGSENDTVAIVYY